MQQLMAMLRDKVGSKVLIASELSNYEDEYGEEDVELKKLDNGKRSRSNSRGAGDNEGEEMMDADS